MAKTTSLYVCIPIDVHLNIQRYYNCSWRPCPQCSWSRLNVQTVANHPILILALAFLHESEGLKKTKSRSTRSSCLLQIPSQFVVVDCSYLACPVHFRHFDLARTWYFSYSLGLPLYCRLAVARRMSLLVVFEFAKFQSCWLPSTFSALWLSLSGLIARL